MEIYILRHGIAEEEAQTGRDEDRELTPEGKRRLVTVLALAHHARVKPDLVFTSPYVRALQTAEIASEILKYEGDLLESTALTPESEPSDVWEELRMHKDCSSVLLSSHNPLVSRLTSHMLACTEFTVDFKKGAMVRIDIDTFGPQPRGVLKWMITSKLAA